MSSINAIKGEINIAYLAPEIPALSATFVYEEFLGLEGKGITITPISVHFPDNLAEDQAAMVQSVYYLYRDLKPLIVLKGLFALLHCKGVSKAVGWLISDMVECGIFRVACWKLLFQFFSAARLAQYMTKKGCKHLHVHFAHVPAQIGMYASALSGIPFTVMAHANDIFERGLLLRQKAERAKKFLTISDYNRTYLERIGLPKEKLAVVRCGVSFPLYPFAHPFQVKKTYRLGTMGRLVEKKGMDVLIRSLVELKGKTFKVELTIAGDGPLRAELEALVRSLDLDTFVCFEGNLSHSEVAIWMRNLDVFVLACKKDSNGDMDGIPVVLMEAMSQYVPVISTHLSGIPELILHNETGLLAKPGDAKDLALQIELLVSSTRMRATLAEMAQRHVVHEFGQDVNILRLLEHCLVKEKGSEVL